MADALLTDPAGPSPAAGGPQSEAGATPAAPASDTLAVAAAAGPGVYTDMPMADYLADPVPGGSLSRSGAMQLLPPSTPAHFRWNQDHPEDQETKKEFDFGHAAHQLVLGSDPMVDVHNFPNWLTKAAKEAKEASRAAGRVPILPKQWKQVEEMAAAIKAHPLASRLLDPESGQPEVTLIWRDEASGVMLRSRLDWLPHPIRGRMIIPDYKTTGKFADKDEFAKSAANYDYHAQAWTQIQAVKALGLAGDAAHVFVVQETNPPYLINTIELDTRALRIGESRMRWAMDIFAHCQKTGKWPGHGDDVDLAELPGWYLRTYDEH